MSEARREYAQLLRIQDRTRKQLEQARDDLKSPGVEKLLKDIRKRTGSAPKSGIADIVRSIEDALRSVQLAASEVHSEIRSDDVILEVEGIDNLPAQLARFLAERDQLPGFSYEVVQDDTRGWMILWKEFTEEGGIRGYGQFYERPYAWLED